MKRFMKHDFIIKSIELACLVKAGQGSNLHKNRKNHGLAIFPDGERIFYFDNKKITVGKNEIVYFPKGCNYKIKQKRESDCYAINFQMADDTVFEPFSVKIKNTGDYLKSFEESRKIWTKKSVGFSAKVKAELYGIIYNMQSEFQIPYTNSVIIQPAMDYIHSNYYKENISVTHLASLCGVSTVYLRNLFIKKFALTPIKYINSLKLSRAKELLSSQMYSVSEVCFLCGYNDESYFSREFKKHYGITPKKASRNK